MKARLKYASIYRKLNPIIAFKHQCKLSWIIERTFECRRIYFGSRRDRKYVILFIWFWIFLKRREIDIFTLCHLYSLWNLSKNNILNCSISILSYIWDRVGNLKKVEEKLEITAGKKLHLTWHLSWNKIVVCRKSKIILRYIKSFDIKKLQLSSIKCNQY